MKKSPCKECLTYINFPECIDDCKTLGKIQSHITNNSNKKCNPDFCLNTQFVVHTHKHAGA